MLKSTFRGIKCIKGSVTECPVFRSAVISNVRQIGTSKTAFNKDVPSVGDSLRYMVKPTKLDKCCLMIARVYKKPSDVPEWVSYQKLERAYDLSRGRTMIVGIFVWGFFLYLAMVYGRRTRDSGVDLHTEGQKRITELQEKGKLERDTHSK